MILRQLEVLRDVEQIYSYIHAGEYKVTDVELRSFECDQASDESPGTELVKVTRK